MKCKYPSIQTTVTSDCCTGQLTLEEGDYVVLSEVDGITTVAFNTEEFCADNPCSFLTDVTTGDTFINVEVDPTDSNKRIVTFNDSNLTAHIEVDNFTYDPVTKVITITESNGDSHPINISDLVDAETVTTFEDNDDSTWTYTNENGDETVININDIVTTLVDNGDGTATYTNEDGDDVTITLGGDTDTITTPSVDSDDFTGTWNVGGAEIPYWFAYQDANGDWKKALAGEDSENCNYTHLIKDNGDGTLTIISGKTDFTIAGHGFTADGDWFLSSTDAGQATQDPIGFAQIAITRIDDDQFTYMATYTNEEIDPLKGLTSKTFTVLTPSTLARAGEYIEASDGTLYASGEALPIAGDYTWWYDASNPISMPLIHYVSHLGDMNNIQRMTPARLGGGYLGYQGEMDFTNNLTIKEIVNPYSTYGWNTLFPTILQGAVNLEELTLGYYPGGIDWGTVDLPLLKTISMSSYAPNRLAGSFDLTRAINLEEVGIGAIGTVYAGEPLIVNINSPVNIVRINYFHKMFVGNELELTLKSLSEAATNTNTTNGTLTFNYGGPTILSGSNSCAYIQTLLGLGWTIVGLSGSSTC